jgi:hypothetical protein
MSRKRADVSIEQPGLGNLLLSLFEQACAEMGLTRMIKSLALMEKPR